VFSRNLASCATPFKTGVRSACTYYISLYFTVTASCSILKGVPKITQAYENLPNKEAFIINAATCGMCYYFYNEMQNIVLGSLGAVPTAVGNTLKRVVIFVALYFFTSGETFPMPKIIGCAIAIAGCLAFAIFDSKKW
jgi:drug/metabolite transporter (DMT)-like permease